MLNIISSRAAEKNPQFVQSKRREKETNTAWLARHHKTLAKTDGADGATYLALFGGSEKAFFRLRVAQSHLRHDMSPSHWSHVVLLQSSQSTKAGAIWEISVEPKDGFKYPPVDNGIQEAHLRDYNSRNQYPNVALMQLPVKLHEMKEVRMRFKRQRAEMDCVELLLMWLGYVWGVGQTVNPLLTGYGMPSAVMVETLAAANDFDLTPGLESRASCPEAIWQAARWWHEYHEQSGNGAIRGMWHMEHFLG